MHLKSAMTLGPKVLRDPHPLASFLSTGCSRTAGKRNAVRKGYESKEQAC